MALKEKFELATGVIGLASNVGLPVDVLAGPDATELKLAEIQADIARLQGIVIEGFQNTNTNNFYRQIQQALETSQAAHLVLSNRASSESVKGAALKDVSDGLSNVVGAVESLIASQVGVFTPGIVEDMYAALAFSLSVQINAAATFQFGEKVNGEYKHGGFLAVKGQIQAGIDAIEAIKPAIDAHYFTSGSIGAVKVGARTVEDPDSGPFIVKVVDILHTMITINHNIEDNAVARAHYLQLASEVVSVGDQDFGDDRFVVDDGRVRIVFRDENTPENSAAQGQRAQFYIREMALVSGDLAYFTLTGEKSDLATGQSSNPAYSWNDPNLIEYSGLVAAAEAVIAGEFIEVGSGGDANVQGTESGDFIKGSSSVDFIFGNDGDDYIDGKQGNDLLFGGEGSDRYFMQTGEMLPLPAPTPTVPFPLPTFSTGGRDGFFDSGSGLDVDVVVFEGNSDLFTFYDDTGSTGPRIRVVNQLHPDSVVLRGIEIIKFDDTDLLVSELTLLPKDSYTPAPDVYDPSAIDELLVVAGATLDGIIVRDTEDGAQQLVGTDGGDFLIADAGGDVFFQRGENGGGDRLFGGAGNDFLMGGSRNNLMFGGEGSDRYFNASGYYDPLTEKYTRYGQDGFLDDGTGAGDTDVVIFEGNRDEYTFYDDTGSTGPRIKVVRDGDPDADVIRGIEILKFDDVDLDVSTLSVANGSLRPKDSDAPDAPVVSDGDGAVVSGTAEANSFVTLATDTRQTVIVQTNDKGVWSYDFGADTDVEDGIYSLTAFASDAVNNSSGSSASFSATVNKIGPSLSVAELTSNLDENTDTTTRIQVASIAVTDDVFGTNDLALTGTDAALFEIDGTTLYLRAGVSLDHETLSQLDVTVTVDDIAFGTTPDASVALTITVNDVNEGPTGNVLVSGTPVEDGTLTAVSTLDDPEGLGTLAYQWLQGGTVIAGATSATYTLGQDDVGATMSVRVSYTDDQGTDESSDSDPTTPVVSSDPTIRGTEEPELLEGTAGDDTIVAGGGADTVEAGDGNDTVFGGNGRDLVRLNQGNDLFNDNTQGGELGRDTVFGGFGNDTIEGGNGDDEFHGEAGADLIFGRLGNDLILGGDQFDTIHAGEGNDTVFGGNGRDLVRLNQGNDLFNDNTQGGEVGRDTVFAGLGNDTIQGGNGNDEFRGEAGNDLIFGRLGNDLIFGGDQFDTINAGEGNDTVFGGNGRDLVRLNQGNDLFNDNTQGGEVGRDTVFAGLGNDTIQGGNGNDEFRGEAGNDLIFGRLGNDLIFGGDQFDTINAGEGNDTVFGGNGRDRIFLGAGDDRYVDTAQIGNLGQDTINGGVGADTFVFGAVMSADVIVDFQVGLDTLQLASSLRGGRTDAQFVTDFASVIGGNVVFDFGAGQSITLDGLTSTVGLADDLSFG